MSAIAEKLIGHKLAMPRTDSPLFMAALEYIKRGGGRARAHEIIERAYERVHPNDDAEASIAMSEKTTRLLPPASSPQASGSGHVGSVPPRQQVFAPPARAPLNLYGAVAHGAMNVLANSVFDRIKTSDGRAWGDVGAHELDGMSRDGALAKAIKDKIGVLSNAQRFMTIRELISIEKFEQARNEAHGS